MLGIRPEMRVKPAQLIRRASPYSVPENRFVWVKHRELFPQEFLRLSQSVGLFQNDVAANGSGHSRNEFNDRLMWQTNWSHR